MFLPITNKLSFAGWLWGKGMLKGKV